MTGPTNETCVAHLKRTVPDASPLVRAKKRADTIRVPHVCRAQGSLMPSVKTLSHIFSTLYVDGTQKLRPTQPQEKVVGLVCRAHHIAAIDWFMAFIVTMPGQHVLSKSCINVSS